MRDGSADVAGLGSPLQRSRRGGAAGSQDTGCQAQAVCGAGSGGGVLGPLRPDSRRGWRAAVAGCRAARGSVACRCVPSILSRMPKRLRSTKNFAALVAGILPDTAKGKPLELWWQDEARVGQQGTLTWVCAARGSRRRSPTTTPGMARRRCSRRSTCWTAPCSANAQHASAASWTCRPPSTASLPSTTRRPSVSSGPPIQTASSPASARLNERQARTTSVWIRCGSCLPPSPLRSGYPSKLVPSGNAEKRMSRLSATPA